MRFKTKNSVAGMTAAALALTQIGIWNSAQIC